MKAFFVFSGQGAQTVGMGRDLYDSCPEAKSIFDQADAVLGYKLSDIIFNGPIEKLTESLYCQDAIYTMSCACLAAFGKKFGSVKPVACAGLSLGEYGALHCAGAFDFATGLKLLAARGGFMDEACRKTAGAMASVLGGDPQVIADVCAQIDLDVANYNCPGQIVISGERPKVEAAVAELKNRGMRKVIMLNVAGAFHSRLMREAGEKLGSVLAQADIRMPAVPVYHNFTADAARSVDEIRKNLTGQVAGSVRWEDCVRRASSAGADTVIEFGPGAVLTGLVRRTVPEMKLVNINSAASLEAAALE